MNEPVTWGDYWLMELGPRVLYIGGLLLFAFVVGAKQFWESLHCRKCGMRLKHGFMCPKCFGE